MRNICNILRWVCLIISVAVIVIPVLWVLATDTGFDPLVSRLLITACGVFLIPFVMLGNHKDERKSMFYRICVCIGIALSVIHAWL